MAGRYDQPRRGGRWANLVEVRDDLDHDPTDPVVTNAIFDLANPELQGPLDLIGLSLCKKLGA